MFYPPKGLCEAEAEWGPFDSFHLLWLERRVCHFQVTAEIRRFQILKMFYLMWWDGWDGTKYRKCPLIFILFTYLEHVYWVLKFDAKLRVVDKNSKLLQVGDFSLFGCKNSLFRHIHCLILKIMLALKHLQCPLGVHDRFNWPGSEGWVYALMDGREYQCPLIFLLCVYIYDVYMYNVHIQVFNYYPEF